MKQENTIKDGPLFETERAKNRGAFKLFTGSMLAGVVFIWVYRALELVNGERSGLQRWVWIGAFSAELWFGFYWILTVALRWNPTRRLTFKERLSQRYETELPPVDIFVCTADPQLEPPAMVINTALSVMAFDYPPPNLSVYLSDDAGSIITFYALWEASRFAKSWIPFCRKHNITTRSPANYFAELPNDGDDETCYIKKTYEDMENRIDNVVKQGKIPEDIQKLCKGFSEWDSRSTSKDHQAIVQILLDGRDADALDVEGLPLPKLVYVAREKRPQYFHNFKAGAMNTLIRVSATISNGPIILNVDCDMYSNNPDTVRDAMCFFMDDDKGDEIGFVQFPQRFKNLTRNDLYGNALSIISQEFHGLDGYGGALYIGTGCFHRRHSLLGNKHIKGQNYKHGLKSNIINHQIQDSTPALEEKAKSLSSCTFELNTEWGNQIGVKYGYPVEDIITGFSVLCNGWKSTYHNPERAAFLGLAPVTLMQTLVQHKRWSEGDFQLFMSKYCPFVCGYGKLHFALQMGYSTYFLWPLNSFPMLFYVVILSLLLLVGRPLFPSVTSLWSVPFLYVIIAELIYSIFESRQCELTLKAWWNDQRMWLFKRTTSYLFAAIDTFLKLLGLQNSTFVLTAKVVTDDVNARYKKEMMEFGMDSPMLTILCTLAFLNLACFVGGMVRMVLGGLVEGLWLHLILSAVVVVINGPVFEGMFTRKDSGRVPSVAVGKSCVLAVGICVVWIGMWIV